MSFVAAIQRRVPGHALLVFFGYAAYYVGLFAPVVLGGRLLMSACDAYIYHYPALFGGRSLWDPFIFGGYPRFADPQVMLWYPLAMPLSFTGWESLWNVFLVTPYVLASCFTYGFVWRLTRSKLGAAIAGLIFGQCGFMIGHMPHVAIVHGVAWLPLILWSLEELRDRFHRGWLAVLAMAVACCFLAGHVQMFVYSMLLAGAYCGWGLVGAPAGWRRYGLASAASVTLGMGLTAVQLLPTSELVPLSDRSKLSFQEFASFSLPARQAPQLLFPYVYGGTDLVSERLSSGAASERVAKGVPYFGPWNFNELSGYCGLLTLVLAGAGLLSRFPTSRDGFWTIVASTGLLLALGDSTPLAQVVYRLPLLSQFRCPCRFLLWFDLALAVLAGTGIRTLQSTPRRRATLAVAVSSMTVLSLVGAAWWMADRQMADPGFLSNATSWRPAAICSSAPWENLAIGVPLIGLALGVVAVGLWQGLRWRDAGLLVLAAVALDMGQFAWLSEWRLNSPSRGAFKAVPKELAGIQADLASSGERLVSLSTVVRSTEHEWDLGNPLHLEVAPGNTGSLWGIAGGFGYTPLSLKRCSQILPPARPRDIGRVNDLLALRYMLDPVRIHRIHGVEFEDLATKTPIVGHPPIGGSLSVSFELAPTTATRLCLVTRLGCAPQIQDGTKLAEVTVRTSAGELPAIALRAGEHLAEHCWERADVKPTVAHRLPSLTEIQPARDEAGRDFRVHLVMASLPLARRADITGVEIRWVGPQGPCLDLQYLTLVDEETDQFHPIRHVRAVDDNWRQQGSLNDGSHLILKNHRPLQRAWFAQRVVETPADKMVEIIHGHAPLPDGSQFRPYETALVERQPGFAAWRGTPPNTQVVRRQQHQVRRHNDAIHDLSIDGALVESPAPVVQSTPDPDAMAAITRYEPQRVVVRTRSVTEALLVLGDVWYPGWEARVDGRQTQIYPTDYVLRGVVVPPGAHEVEFEFRPQSLRHGLAVSGVSLVLLLGTLVTGLWRPADGGPTIGGRLNG